MQTMSAREVDCSTTVLKNATQFKRYSRKEGRVVVLSRLIAHGETRRSTVASKVGRETCDREDFLRDDEAARKTNDREVGLGEPTASVVDIS